VIKKITKDLFAALSSDVFRQPCQSLANHEGPIRGWPAFSFENVADTIRFIDI
jgi:hypothetical protein